MNRALPITAVMFALAATPALAHTGAGPVSGATAGLLHPLMGLDHLLAMIAVGVLAAQQGGRSRWTIPAAFVGMMVVGGLVAMAGIGLPLVEIGIAGSVILLGAIVALGRKMPTGLAMAVVGSLAVFHGHAHGTEIPALAGMLPYFLGFAAATAALHGIGIALAAGTERLATALAPTAIRAGGAAVAASGALLVVG